MTRDGGVNVSKNVNKRKKSTVSDFAFIYIFVLNENVFNIPARNLLYIHIDIIIAHANDLIFYTNSLSFQMKNVGNAIKISALVVIWIVFTATLMSRDEKELAYQPISVPVGAHKSNGNFYERKKRIF